MRDRLRDPDRLRVLRDLAILDTPREPAYDDLAIVTRAACSGQVAAVNFVDQDRHWTKAVAGATGHRASVPSDVSFCAATVRTSGGELYLADTAADPHWSRHPFVTGEPHVGHYLGRAIVVGHQPVGVICTFGTGPRSFDLGERRVLEALARQASAHLELRLRNASLRELAVRDPLTGLANRALLVEQLSRSLARRARTGEEVGLLFCDADGLKAINDRFGHAAGDALLCEVAKQLQSIVRRADVVARIAGDEFVVLCPGIASESELSEVAGRIIAEVSATAPDGTRRLRLSVGAVMHRHGETPEELMDRADAAMYRAKYAPVS